MNEKWRPVIGYDGIYEISSFGRCRNVKYNRIIWTDLVRSYPRFKLCKNGIQTYIESIILVAQAFIPNPNNYLGVTVKNGCGADAKMDNIIWVDDNSISCIHVVK